MAMDISVDLCGIKLKNPFVLAASHAAKPANFRKIADAGWAAGLLPASRHVGHGISAVYGSIPAEIDFIDRPPAFFAYQNTCSSVGLAEVGISRQAELIEKDVLEAKQAEMPIGVNLAGMEDTKDWVDGAIMAEKSGASFLECNFSNPYVPGFGLVIFGKYPEKMQTIIKAIKEKCSLPVVAKLSAHPLPENLAVSAKLVVDGGADAISVSNALIGFTGVDIETGMPLNLYQDVNGQMRGSCCGISGPATKYMVLRAVAELYQTVDVPIWAIGGISSWQTAVEYMMLGASVIEVGVGAMLYGYRIVRSLIRGLENFMERKGYETLDDFVGYTNKKYGVGKPFTNPEYKQPRQMVVDEDKCDGCGLCVLACEATAKSALKVEDRLAIIDHDKCETCNSCMFVCPRRAVSTRWEAGVV